MTSPPSAPHVAAFPREALDWPWPALRDALDRAREGGARVALFDASGDGGARWPEADLLALERYPLPAVAALEGDVGGHALDLALSCDIRVASAGAQLRFRTVANRRMMQLLGISRTVDVLELGGRVPAGAALACGLVSRVAAGAPALELGQSVAAAVASRGPIATQLGKEALWRGLGMTLEQGLRFETDLTLLLQTTNDRAEGVRAFLEKRPPQFTGK